MESVSKEQQNTRRRALGRRLITKASAITIDLKAIQESVDLQFLTDSEREALDRQLEAMSKIMRNFNRLGDKLDSGQ